MKSNPRTIVDTPIYLGLIVLLVAFLGVRAWVGYWIHASKQTKFCVLFDLLFSALSNSCEVVVDVSQVDINVPRSAYWERCIFFLY